MKRSICRAAALTGVMTAFAAFPAHAGLVTFDDLSPNLYFPGDAFVSGGLNFSLSPQFLSVPQPGFGTVDTAAGLSSFSNAPTGNSTQFYAGLNDNSVTMSAGSQVFVLASFDFGFVPPVGTSGSSSPGALIAYWTDAFGATGFSGFDFGSADSNGDWAFLRANMAAPSFSSGAPTTVDFQSVTFFACLYSGPECNRPANNQAQFALDNITANVPLPSSLLLAGLGLAGLVVTRRRVAV